MAVAIILPLQLTTGFLDKAASAMSAFFYGTQSGTFNSPIKTVVKPVVKGIHGFMMDTASLSDKVTGVLSIIIAALLIFAALSYMVKCMRALTASKLEKTINRVFSSNIYLTFLIGIAITAIIQSSSITTSMLVPVVGAGLITLEQAFPVTVGANIGTTVTALMAALAGNQAGLTIAFVHLIFNLSGTLILFVPPWTRRMPLRVARFMARNFIARKKLALVYILLVFFVIPITFMLITRNW
ncbi:MAG: Na/Pi symporter [Deltaproteobacteria bacterium]|nr:Na/Pi symporter [Deltaproteobacteria bacterium]